MLLANQYCGQLFQNLKSQIERRTFSTNVFLFSQRKHLLDNPWPHDFVSSWSKKFLFIRGNKRNSSIKKSCRTFGDQKLAEMFTLVVFYVNSSCHQQQLLHLMRRGNHRFLLCEVTHRFLNLSCSSNMAGICILHFKHANCHATHFFFPSYFYWISRVFL